MNTCPNCGYCPACGRKQNLQPYNPFYPYTAPVPIYPNQPIWISSGIPAAAGNVGTVVLTTISN